MEIKDFIIGILASVLICKLEFWEFNCFMQYVFLFVFTFAAVLNLLDFIGEKMGPSAATRKSHCLKQRQ